MHLSAIELAGSARACSVAGSAPAWARAATVLCATASSCLQVDHYILIDAGARDSLLWGSHACSLARAVQRRLAPAKRGGEPGQLDLIVCA